MIRSCIFAFSASMIGIVVLSLASPAIYWSSVSDEVATALIGGRDCVYRWAGPHEHTHFCASCSDDQPVHEDCEEEMDPENMGDEEPECTRIHNEDGVYDKWNGTIRGAGWEDCGNDPDCGDGAPTSYVTCG